jgi:hypothetical protein
MSSLPDGLSMGALIVAIISGCFVFLKSIKKCRLSRTSGLEIERETSEKEIVNHQDFMINLIKTLQEKENKNRYQSPRRCASDDALPWNSRTAIKKTDEIDIPVYRYPKIPVNNTTNSPVKKTKPLHSMFISNNNNKKVKPDIPQ